MWQGVFMKKRLFFMGMLVGLLTLSLVIAGCDDGNNNNNNNNNNTSPFEGSWEGHFTNGFGDVSILTFSGNNLTIVTNGDNDRKGTFTSDGTTLYITFTHVWNVSVWDSISATLDYPYTIAGTTLTLTDVGYPDIVLNNNNVANPFIGTWTGTTSQGFQTYVFVGATFTVTNIAEVLTGTYTHTATTAHFIITGSVPPNHSAIGMEGDITLDAGGNSFTNSGFVFTKQP
jgi:hypothetical protein